MDDFENWYRAVSPRLLNSVTLTQSSSDEAADICAEALATAFENWDRVRRMDQPDGWVFRVAFNLARRRGTRRTRERELLVATTPRVNRTEPANAALVELSELLDGLSDSLRSTVVLRHVADLTEPMIAEVLGVSRGTVSSNLRDAYRRLASSLESDAQEARP